MGSETLVQGSLGSSVSGPVVRPAEYGGEAHGPLTVDRKQKETHRKRQTTLQMPAPGGEDAL